MKVGILGGGQLAQLLTHAAYPLAIKTVHITTSDLDEILTIAKTCDVLTIENENIDIALLTTLAEHVPVYPGIEAIRIAQDRLLEKTFFQSMNIPTTRFSEINSLAELETAIKQIGLPAILKTRRFGYDGKGQVVIKHHEEAAAAWKSIGGKSAILESFISFDGEVSLIAARNPTGEIIFYPLIKNTHEAGILRRAACPYHNQHLQALAEDYTGRLLTAFAYVGVLAFEFFVLDNTLIANEIAPRVHNSGHLTIEGFNVSQFESHLRGILDLPLMQPVLQTATVMDNIIGTFPQLSHADYQNKHVYDYGKTARPGRKLGHIISFVPSTTVETA